MVEARLKLDEEGFARDLAKYNRARLSWSHVCKSFAANATLDGRKQEWWALSQAIYRTLGIEQTKQERIRVGRFSTCEGLAAKMIEALNMDPESENAVKVRQAEAEALAYSQLLLDGKEKAGPSTNKPWSTEDQASAMIDAEVTALALAEGATIAPEPDIDLKDPLNYKVHMKTTSSGNAKRAADDIIAKESTINRYEAIARSLLAQGR